MLYYIENNVVIAKSETPLQIWKWIEEREIKTIFQTPYLEDNEIIEYKNSQEFQEKKNDKFLLENKEEIEKLKNYWYIITIEDFKIIKSDTELSLFKKEKESKDKILNDINKEFQETYKTITSGYLPEEIASWDYQIQEAKNVHWWGNSNFLTRMLKDWETLTELKDKILNNETLFKNAYADAIKIKRDKLALLEV